MLPIDRERKLTSISPRINSTTCLPAISRCLVDWILKISIQNVQCRIFFSVFAIEENMCAFEILNEKFHHTHKEAVEAILKVHSTDLFPLGSLIKRPDTTNKQCNWCRWVYIVDNKTKLHTFIYTCSFFTYFFIFLWFLL